MNENDAITRKERDIGSGAEDNLLDYANDVLSRRKLRVKLIIRVLNMTPVSMTVQKKTTARNQL